MLQIIAFLVLALLMVITLVLISIFGIIRMWSSLKKKSDSKRGMNFKKLVAFFSVVMVLNIGVVVLSQLTAFTPKIKDESGETPKNSIAELVKVELNGRKQWISLRGWDQNKPILLFLAGGPGGSQMGAVRHELSDLEKDFVVVNWDQPGSGKSYYGEKIKNITVETYIQDGHALTEYLLKRFSKEKIYLIGESWGSALGIFLIDKYPETYHGFIGSGQMIDFEETERMDYTKAMEIAKEHKDKEIIEKMKANGAPPYYGENVTWKIGLYLNYLSASMANNQAIHNPGYNTLRDIGSSEYGLLDKFNYIRGIIKTFNHVYQKLYDINMRTDFRKLDTPMYFYLGRHDINAPTSLVEEYVELLNAPKKEIVWFEHSGHSPWINEGDQFVNKVLSCFLEELK